MGYTIWRSELVSVEKLSDDLCVGGHMYRDWETDRKSVV